MLRSELIDLLNEKYNSNLYDLILDRLEFFSYEVTEKDIPIIVQCLQMVVNDVEIQCNVDEIPEKYDLHIAGAVVAEFLSMKKALNQLDISSLDLSSAIASVSMGNTSVSYNAGDSDSARFDALVSASRNNLKAVYPCLRKVKF